MENTEKKDPTLKIFIIVVTVIMFSIVGLVLYVRGHQIHQQYNISYDNLPSLGKQDAPVKVIEYADFKCPVCKDWTEENFAPFKKEYIDTGKVQFFFANYPVINDSDTAALAGKSIYKQNNDAFWKYYEAVYKNQKSEKENWATKEFLIQLVKDYVPGVDLQKLKSDLDNKVYANDVQGDVVQGERIGVTSTPTFFVNGKRVGLEYNKIREVIDGELAKP